MKRDKETKDFERLANSGLNYLLMRLKKRTNFKKPLNPHAFRHSRLTELSKYLSDAKLKVFAGWTASSRMSGVYVHLAGKDLDDDLLRIAGVKVEEEKPVSPLKSKECPRCHTENPGPAEYCMLCGRPFNEKLLIEQTLETEDLKFKVATLEEELKTALRDYNSMTKSMIKVVNELQEAKKAER